jgi:hypothetical protein
VCELYSVYQSKMLRHHDMCVDQQAFKHFFSCVSFMREFFFETNNVDRMRRRHQGFDSDSDDDNGGRPQLLASYQHKQSQQPLTQVTSTTSVACASPPPHAVPPVTVSEAAPDGASIADATAVSLEALEPLSALLKDALAGMDTHVRDVMHKAVEEHHKGAASSGDMEGDEAAEDIDALSEEEFQQHVEALQKDMDAEFGTLQRLVDQRKGFLHAQRHAWESYRSKIDPDEDRPDAAAAIEREIAAVQDETAAVQTSITEQQKYMERISTRNKAEVEYMVQEINHLRFRHQKQQEQLQRRAAAS